MIAIDTVHTDAVVVTRHGGTFVDIYLTVSAIVARLAVAPVVINQVFARASRLTGVIFTIVDILKNKCMVSVKAEAMLRCLTWEQFLPEYPGLQ